MADDHDDEGHWFSLPGLLPPIIAAGLFAAFWRALPTVADGGSIRHVTQWVPGMGVDLSFVIDGLSLTFALLITGIGTLVMLYSARYMAGHPQHDRFSLYLTAFMLSMLGVVLADNLIALFVFWELTTITSFLLIGFSHASGTSRRAALQALLVTGAGGLAMLAGVIVIGQVAGTYELSEIRAMGGVLRDSPAYLAIFVLIVLGAFTKSAQLPFHFWLPNAMAAPTPVSAFLHSATMVKGGVYLLARMHPSLAGTDVWLWTLTIFGGVTAVFASVVALRQTDLKQTLAYTTLMALGTLVLFLAAPGGYAITAAVTFLVIHSLYKAALFLMIGCVDHRTGTRDAALLGGLWRKMPLTALAAALAGMSMAGIPPFLGFIGKELLYKGGLESTASVVFVILATLLASALMFAVGAIVALKPFWGRAENLSERNSAKGEAPWQMLVGPLLLGGLGLYFGLFPHWLQDNSITPTVAALLGDPAQAKELHLWAGVNTALYLSGVTFLLGIILYLWHLRLRAGLTRIDDASFSFDRGWDAFLVGITRCAGWLTDRLQTGDLRQYMLVVFGTILAGLLLVIGRTGLNVQIPPLPDLHMKQYFVVILMIAGTGLAVMTRSRIAAIGGLGVVGIGVALIFIIYSAPDVAITQLMVETLVVVLFGVAALRLPVLPSREQEGARWGHAALAIAVGTTVSLILLTVTNGTLDLRLTDYFAAESYPTAFGRNIVNVILVDFRAFDTFGEISVVVVAALSAVALLRQGGKHAKSQSRTEEDRT
ncbi:hydrogen gas-evolving membrane-bound hydrogenase subunit E [Pseudoruegeria sp. SK021]|uniref:hydrogen gas-evolving membrane-bound hydrogenase subunit E n=1 Tax=Pseudoruegeria sp. SK021 TaxID=1933035 RepID=UPI000A22B4A4|nr:hydrogen gas-evolving membrane-bound hydrogenase subunit E [Pseudoruegeria sp. SK021]OSP56821.1 Na(+)/H(+) antiporter subunit A [Pseudoruegeria sp. SK021]